MLAHWIVNGRPDVDVTGFNIDRLHTYQANPEYRRTRTVESLGMVYQCHYPTRSMQTARGAKLSPVHHRLAAAGAYFHDVSGWEGADWYAGAGVEPDPGPLTWGRPEWFDHWRAEHEAARNGVIVMDMSFMSKFLVQGRDAGRLLDQLSANAVDGLAGRITYTQWLNEAGRIEADLTVTKLGDDDFWVVATDTAHRHVETWMRRHIGEQHAFVTDVTSGFAQLNVQGPRSRELLQAVTSTRHVERGVPVPRRARDRHRVRPGVVRAHHLPRRARLRAVRPRRTGRPRVRPARRSGRAVRPAPRRAEGAGEPAHGEGLPRLRPRHRQHRHGARGRARLRGGDRQAGRLHRTRRRGRRPARPARRRDASCRSSSPTPIR